MPLDEAQFYFYFPVLPEAHHEHKCLSRS